MTTKQYKELDGYTVCNWVKPTATGGRIIGTTVSHKSGRQVEFIAKLSRKEAIKQAKFQQV